MSNPEDYTRGADRYVRFAEDFLDLRIAELQRRLLRAVAQNQYTLVWGANGPGKSFITAALKMGFLFSNPDSIVLGTSGSYGQYHDTMWKPLENMHKQAQREKGLPGNIKGGNQPVLKLDTEWYCKVVSPRSPDELEGRHGPNVLVVIDEADKPYVTEEHFSSAKSSVTDMNDKVVAICNPPVDESNVVYQKRNDPRWEVVEFSSFDAHNVRVDAGELDEEPIPGIVDLITLADDWEGDNREAWPRVGEVYPGEWPGMPEIKNQLEDGVVSRDQVVEWLRPGFEVARTAHKNRQDLSEDWYRRRAGVMPPAGSEKHRPIYADDVHLEPRAEFGTNRYGIGVDIGRTGDSTGIIEVRRVENAAEDTFGLYVRTDVGGSRTHGDNESMCRASLEDGPLLAPFAVDAMGEGSGVADQMAAEYSQAVRFEAGMVPVDPRSAKEYKNRRTEALALLGEFLRDGGVIANERLEEELYMAARHIQYHRRRSKGRDVFAATPKEKLKDELGHSPDLLDAAAIAVWCHQEANERTIRDVSENERQSIPSSW